LKQVASVFDIGWECSQSSSAALMFGPCDCRPSTSDLCLVKHPLQWFCVDLPVPFHLFCWHGLALLDHFRISAVLAENALIFDHFINCG
jgi:hypothetical protein